MSGFAEAAQGHVDFVTAGPRGEVVEYLPHGETVPVPVRATITRNPVTPEGQVLANTVRLWISKAQVPGLCLQRDKFRIPDPHRKPGEVPPWYTAIQLDGDGIAHYWVLCTR